jgi:hypothetical protein
VAGNRKGILLRLDPAVHDALTRWAGDELRSTNAQIEFLLRDALNKAGRMPKQARSIPRRGRPPRDTAPENNAAEDGADKDTEQEGDAQDDTQDDDDPDAQDTGPQENTGA